MQPPLYDFDAMQLRIDYARAALDNIDLLGRAFIWDRTPQGRTYWERQAAEGLDHEGRSTIAYMVAQSIELEIHSAFAERAAA